MRCRNGIIPVNEETYGVLKFVGFAGEAVDNEEGGEIKKRRYDLLCPLQGCAIRVNLPAEKEEKDIPYMADVVLVNPIARTVTNVVNNRAECTWYTDAEDIVLSNANSVKNDKPVTQQGASKPVSDKAHP